MADCHFCDPALVADEGLVYRDEHWTAGVGAGAEVPGWILVWSNRHVEGLWNLDDEEAGTIGEVLRAVSRAVHDVCDAERVYLTAFGEAVPHFHAMLLPRTADTPADARSAALLGRMTEFADRDRAYAVAGGIRQQMDAR